MFDSALKCARKRLGTADKWEIFDRVFAGLGSSGREQLDGNSSSKTMLERVP
jgi:hypothetical protein